MEIEPTACAMVGDRLRDDVDGAQAVGMKAIWKRTDKAWAQPDQVPQEVTPLAVIDRLSELPPILAQWNGQ